MKKCLLFLTCGILAITSFAQNSQIYDKESIALKAESEINNWGAKLGESNVHIGLVLCNT